MTQQSKEASKKDSFINNPFEALERIESTLARIENETLPILIKRLTKAQMELGSGPEKLVSKKEAARLLGCSVSTIDNLRRKGRLELVKVGKSARFRLGDLQSMIGGSEEV